MRGHSRPKDGVASLAYDPRIHDERPQDQPYELLSSNIIMDCWAFAR
jgi:hypothetical protein